MQSFEAGGTTPGLWGEGMRVISRKLRMRTVTAAFLAVGTVLSVIVTAAPASAGATSGERCISYHTWSTTLEVNYKDVPPAGPSVDDEVTYHENLFRISDDVKVGERDGYEKVLYARASDSHLIGIMIDTGTFPDGVIGATGLVDFTLATGGSPFTIPAYGRSGAYRGMFGTYTIADTGFTPRDEVHFELCRR